MRVVIGYESMYGNTRHIAQAVAAGFSPDDDVTILPMHVLDVGATTADVLVIGAPTHAHGLPSAKSRRAAIDGAGTRYERHRLEESAPATGVREWLDKLPGEVTAGVATFDTRFRPPAWLTGHPARRIMRTLVGRGATSLDRPQSFFVDKHENLRDGELQRAERWGAELRSRADRNAGARSHS